VARGRCSWRRSGRVHPGGTAGYGSRRPHKGCRDNVGKGHVAAGGWQQPAKTACARETAAARRDGVWRMSPYERRRRGNALPGGLRGHPGARHRAKGLWALGGLMLHPHQTQSWILRPRSLWGEGMGQRAVVGVDASQRLSASGATEDPSPTNRVRAEARTGLGKPDRPGSQGGQRKRDPRWKWEPTPQPKGREW
jgi:hypothetical protein